MSEPVGRQAPTVLSQELGDELSLFDPATGTAVSLNKTARGIWSLLDGTRTVDDIVANLAQAYRVEPSVIELEVRAALQQLVDAGVVVTSEPQRTE